MPGQLGLDIFECLVEGKKVPTDKSRSRPSTCLDSVQNYIQLLIITYYVLVLLEDLRYFGVESGVASLEACKQLCAANSTCVGIEYNAGAEVKTS